MPALGAFKNCFSPEKQQTPPFLSKIREQQALPPEIGF
jgi:hypothetical protein